MNLKQIETTIKDLQQDMKLSYRRTVDDAIKIGELLKDAKSQLPHGDFMPWCERQGMKQWTSDKYIKLADYKSKMVNITNLEQAYKLIESEENKRKRQEFEEQTERIQEYKKTGIKPEGWNESTDAYRLRKEKEDAEYEERKRKAFEERKKKLDEESKKHDEVLENDRKETDEILSGLQDMMNTNEEKEKLLSKMRLTGDNAKEPIYEALLQYLMSLNESTRLEACHNIIKFCKGIATECQKNSIQ